MKLHQRFKLHTNFRHSGRVRNDDAQIDLVGGELPYLWVGDRIMYGTITNRRTLRALAKRILEVLDG